MSRQTDDATGGELFRRGDVFTNEWKTLTVVQDGTDANGKVKVKTDIGTTDRVAPRELIELATDDTEVPGR